MLCLDILKLPLINFLGTAVYTLQQQRHGFYFNCVSVAYIKKQGQN